MYKTVLFLVIMYVKNVLKESKLLRSIWMDHFLLSGMIKIELNL
jgi:hypothetical protein